MVSLSEGAGFGAGSNRAGWMDDDQNDIYLHHWVDIVDRHMKANNNSYARKLKMLSTRKLLHYKKLVTPPNQDWRDERIRSIALIAIFEEWQVSRIVDR